MREETTVNQRMSMKMVDWLKKIMSQNIAASGSRWVTFLPTVGKESSWMIQISQFFPVPQIKECLPRTKTLGSGADSATWPFRAIRSFCLQRWGKFWKMQKLPDIWGNNCNFEKFCFKFHGHLRHDERLLRRSPIRPAAQFSPAWHVFCRECR